MQTGIAAAVAAMDQAIRRLDAALAQRAGAFRRLAEQHGLLSAEVKTLREDLQAAREEAGPLRERAALVDALRAELAQIQNDNARLDADDAALRQTLATKDAIIASRDSEMAVLKEMVESLQAGLIPSAVDLEDYSIVESKVELGRTAATDMLRRQYGDKAAEGMLELWESQQNLAVRDGEIAALKDERDMLRTQLAAALDAQEALKRMALAAPAAVPVVVADNSGDMAALKAELAAAKAAQTEMQAFQSGIAARLEATMARLRQALDSQAQV